MTSGVTRKSHNWIVEIKAASKFLERVRRSKLEAFPAIGEGEDVRISARDLTGAALAKKERVIHLSAFHLGGTSNRKPGSRREA